jgi:hypothetical protein
LVLSVIPYIAFPVTPGFAARFLRASPIPAAGEEERARRLAFFALSRAGPAAVSGLLAIAADPPRLGGVTELTQAYSNKLLGTIARVIPSFYTAVYCRWLSFLEGSTQ